MAQYEPTEVSGNSFIFQKTNDLRIRRYGFLGLKWHIEQKYKNISGGADEWCKIETV